MPIAVGCPGCNAQYSVPEKFAGQRMKCKACGAVLTVPASEPDLAPLEDELPAPARTAPAKPVSKPVSRPAAAPKPAAKAPAPASTGYGLGDLLDEELPALPPVPCPKCGELVHAALKECGSCGAVMVNKRAAAAMRASEEGEEGGGGHGHGGEKPKKKKKKKKSSSPSGSIPTFCIVVLCLDVLGSGLRGFAFLSDFAALSTPEGVRMGMSVHFSAWTALAVCVLGFLSIGSMFSKQPWGANVGYATVAATVLNILGTVMGQFAAIKIAAAAANAPEGVETFAKGLAVVGMLIRGGYLALYAAAVNSYSDWATSGRSS